MCLVFLIISLPASDSTVHAYLPNSVFVCTLTSNCLRLVNPNPTENRKSIMSVSGQHEIVSESAAQFSITDERQSFKSKSYLQRFM